MAGRQIEGKYGRRHRLLTPHDLAGIIGNQGSGSGPSGPIDYNTLINKPTLGTAAAANITDFATVVQGSKADSAVQSVVAGTNITVDNTDPHNPVVSSSGGSGSSPVIWDMNNRAAPVTILGNGLTVGPISTFTGAVSNSVLATVGYSSGKKYFEIRVDAQGDSIYSHVGVAPSGGNLNGNSLSSVAVGGWSYYQQTGNKAHNGTTSTFGSTWASYNLVIGIAVDLSAGNIWFALGNVWQASGNPSGGTNAAFTGLTGTLYPGCSIYSGNGSYLTASFKSSAFRYAPPTGFSAWDPN